MIKPRFKIGQWVYVKGTEKKIKLLVVEVIINICDGGEQHYYVGRPITAEEFMRTTLAKLEKFAELELES